MRIKKAGLGQVLTRFWSQTPTWRPVLIVDDEPIARQILLNYVAQMHNLECAGECKNAFEAIEKINADALIQILFLDIAMPNLNGMAMVKTSVEIPIGA